MQRNMGFSEHCACPKEQSNLPSQSHAYIATGCCPRHETLNASYTGLSRANSEHKGNDSYPTVLGVAAFGNDRSAMLEPPPQQCLCNCLAILLCNTGYFCILQQNLSFCQHPEHSSACSVLNDIMTEVPLERISVLLAILIVRILKANNIQDPAALTLTLSLLHKTQDLRQVACINCTQCIRAQSTLHFGIG